MTWVFGKKWTFDDDIERWIYFRFTRNGSSFGGKTRVKQITHLLRLFEYKIIGLEEIDILQSIHHKLLF